MPVIFLFIDGVGLGGDADWNPFAARHYPGFTTMSGDQPFTEAVSEVEEDSHLFRQIDARLDVDGLPQSGTGQVTLFSGENASKEIGRHFGPFPHTGIKHLLREHSLFQKAQQAGKSCHFINAYPEIFFKKAKKRNRWSCTTLMAKSAGIPLNTTEDVKAGKAITAGLTQHAWREQLNIDVPAITPEEAAGRLLESSEAYDLTLYEYYLSDKAGHSRDMDYADFVLARYDRFLQYLIENKSPGSTIVLSSDHGNVEDLSTKTHTLNNVPLFVYGSGTKHFLGAKSIMDVTPGILDTLNEDRL